MLLLKDNLSCKITILTIFESRYAISNDVYVLLITSRNNIAKATHP
jgi:hypothetical protein